MLLSGRGRLVFVSVARDKERRKALRVEGWGYASTLVAGDRMKVLASSETLSWL